MLAGHRELSLGGAGTPALVPNTGSESGDNAVSHFFSLNTLASSVCPLVGFTFWQAVLIVFLFFFQMSLSQGGQKYSQGLFGSTWTLLHSHLGDLGWWLLAQP